MPSKKVTVNDYYYKLAKEQGYRARSAFKMVQLHEKYNLLDANCQKVIDLCAAPGGWLQVCAKYMKKTSETQIIGIDLLPIKPLKDCVCFTADITSAKARQLIKHEMNNKKADLIICDGAPNVGAEYSKDAFVQAELVLHALRFATEHLKKNGNFVSKVFRSQDYNALMWALRQFFDKVEATKPASSRNVSAEIFVVCRGYKAPSKIDPRLLDVKHVFANLAGPTSSQQNEQLIKNVLHKRTNLNAKNRSGYDDDAPMNMFRRGTVKEFILSSDPVRLLGLYNALSFADQDDDDVDAVDKAIIRCVHTTQEVRILCADLRVLGRTDFKALLKWRLRVRNDLLEIGSLASTTSRRERHNAEQQAEAQKRRDEIEAREATMDSDDELDERIADFEKKKAKQLKKAEQKKRRSLIKLQRRKDIGMDAAYVVDADEQEGPFSLERLGVAEDNVRKMAGLESVSIERDDDTKRVFSKLEEKRNRTEEKINYEISDRLDGEDYVASLESNFEANYERYKALQEKAEPMTVRDRRRKILAERTAKQGKKRLEALTAEDFQKVLKEAEKEAYEKGAYEKLLRRGEIEGKESDDSSSSEAGRRG